MKSLMLLCLMAIGSFAHALNYEEPVVLTGKVKLLTASADITADEKPHTYYAIELNKPVNLFGAHDDDINNTNYMNVRVIQLAPALKDIKTVKLFSGKRVSASCSLFQAHTGFHYENVLCDLKSIRVLGGKSE